MTYHHSLRDMEVVDTPDGGSLFVPVESLPRELLAKLGNFRLVVLPPGGRAGEETFGQWEGKAPQEEATDREKPQGVGRSPPMSPDPRSTRKPVFEFRDSERHPGVAVGEQDQEVLKSLAESTPQKGRPEDRQLSARKESSSVDENFNLTPRKVKDASSLVSGDHQEKIKRQLFTSFEDFRVKRSAPEGFRHRSLSEDYDDVRQRSPMTESMSRLMTFIHKSSSSPEMNRSFFERDTLLGSDLAPSSPCRTGRFPVSTSSPAPRQNAPPSPRPGGSTSPKFFHSCHPYQRCSCESHAAPRREVRLEQYEPPKKRVCVEKTMDFLQSKTAEFSQSKTEEPPNCTCANMKNHFLRMAEHAYKNIRRRDTTPESFEQFLRELAQTNETLLEAMSVLETIKDMCEHGKVSAVHAR